MKTNPLKDGAITENSAGIGTVTRKMVRERAVELAVINGRSAQEASKADWEEAKQELTGDTDTNPKELAFESTPETEHWDPVPGSPGHQTPVTGSEDEDEEGQSDNTRLTEEGMAGAEYDSLREAAKDAAKR